MFGHGKLRYEIGARPDVIPCGGIGAFHRLAVKLGLVKELDARLHLLKRHLPYHESDHVLNLTYNVLCGGTRLEDLERLRQDAAYMNALGAELIPDPTTAGDFCRRFDRDELLEALLEAINAVRPQLWAKRARRLLGAIAYLDVDGTIVGTEGERKAGMDLSYKGIWGYAPLLVSLANTQEVLYVVNRPGNVPSHTDAARWIDRAIALVQPHTRRVCLRGDSDFALSRHFDRWAQQVDFVFATDSIAALRERAAALPEGAWKRLPRRPAYVPQTDQRRNRERYQPHEKERIVRERGYENLRLQYEDVAEFDYQPGACQRSYRMVVVRKNISKERGEAVLFEDIRYLFYITTRRELSAAEVVACAHERCDQENLIAQLKDGVNALRVPLYDLRSNWAYMVIAALAWNLKSWWALMLPTVAQRRQYLRLEFRRFLHGVVLIPCQVWHRARGRTLRLLGYQATMKDFFSAWHTIGQLAF